MCSCRPCHMQAGWGACTHLGSAVARQASSSVGLCLHCLYLMQHSSNCKAAAAPQISGNHSQRKVCGESK